MAKKIVKKSKVSKAAKKPQAVKSAPVVIAKSTIGIQPLGDRVVVKPLSPEEAGRTLASGIIIPETVNKEKPEQGTVVAVGPGKRMEDGSLSIMPVSIGDKVMFSKYGYDEIKVDGVEYYIVSESSVLAIIAK